MAPQVPACRGNKRNSSGVIGVTEFIVTIRQYEPAESFAAFGNHRRPIFVGETLAVALEILSSGNHPEADFCKGNRTPNRGRLEPLSSQERRKAIYAYTGKGKSH